MNTTTSKFLLVEEDLVVCSEVLNLPCLECSRQVKHLFRDHQRHISNILRSSSARQSYDALDLIDFFKSTSRFYMVFERCIGGNSMCTPRIKAIND